MTVKIVSFVPISIAAIIFGNTITVNGDVGNLRGPSTKGVQRIRSLEDVTFINPIEVDLSENDSATISQNHTQHAGEKFLERRENVDKKTIESRAQIRIQTDELHREQQEAKFVAGEQKLVNLEDEKTEVHQNIQQSWEDLKLRVQQQSTFEKDKAGVKEDEEETVELYESDSNENCIFSFHGEDDLHDSLKTANVDDQENCRLTATIVSKSEVHARSLIGDGSCHFDTTHGYWYIADCVSGEDENDGDQKKGKQLPRFVFKKFFCSQGCEQCADPDELPGVNGRPDGPLFRTWGRPAYAVCELPPQTEITKNKKKKRKKRDATLVQYEGNCIQQTCKRGFISTMSKILY